MVSILAILAAGDPPSPTSLSMPNVVVEVAFNAGWATPAALRTWTDVSDFVELGEPGGGLTIIVGRGDEFAVADANKLTLTLDNRDGRFTPGRAASPYYPYVKLNRPIRVTATPVDGWASVRFLGFIDEWPTDWDGTDAYAYATVTASSRLSRLGSQEQLPSIIEVTLLADVPVAYYTLGEPAGATQANDSSGSNANPLTLLGDPTLPVVFGNATGPGTDGLTAAQFAGGQYLAGVGQAVSTDFTLEAFFSCSAAPATTFVLAQSGVGILGIDSAGHAFVQAGGLPFTAGTTNVCDGKVHHLALVKSGVGGTIYLDGVNFGGIASSGSSGDMGVGVPLTNALVGAVSHVALYASALTGAQVAAHYAAGSTGFAGETTSARLARYAALAGIPATEVVTETGQTTMSHVDSTGKTPVDLMRVCEATEGGVLFDSPAGELTMQNRSHRYALTSSYTLTMTEGEVEQGYRPKLDRSTLLNDVTAKNVDGSVTAHAFDKPSKDDNGVASTSIETASQSVTEPANLAGWAVFQFKDPKERAPQLAVNATAQVGKSPTCAGVMATRVGDKTTVAARPAQASSASIDYFVEGWVEQYSPEQLMFTFNVSPSSPYDQALIFGDAVRGQLGVNPMPL